MGDAGDPDRMNDPLPGPAAHDDRVDPLVACLLAMEDAASGDGERVDRERALLDHGRSLAHAWEASTSSSTLLVIGELGSPLPDMIRAALACAHLAHTHCPSSDPDVPPYLDLLHRWLDGDAPDADVRAAANLLALRYSGRRGPPERITAAWATYCALSVGRSPRATAWYHARVAASCAEHALRLAGQPAPEATVAAIVRHHVRCPSPPRLVTAFLDESFTLP